MKLIEYKSLYREAQKKMDKLQKEIDLIEEHLYIASETVVPPPMDNRRPATAKDIVEGNFIWHQRSEEHGGDYFHIIEEVLHPNDDFKAYISDGCRYGLHKAYVEIE